MSAPRRVSSEPLEKLVRVTAERHRFDVMSEFSYTDVTQQRGPTVARESGSCPADTGCGEPRVEERYNWGSEYVTEARCAFQLTLTPEAGRTYHLQYDFYGDQRCTLTLLASE